MRCTTKSLWPTRIKWHDSLNANVCRRSRSYRDHKMFYRSWKEQLVCASHAIRITWKNSRDWCSKICERKLVEKWKIISNQEKWWGDHEIFMLHWAQLSKIPRIQDRYLAYKNGESDSEASLKSTSWSENLPVHEVNRFDIPVRRWLAAPSFFLQFFAFLGFVPFSLESFFSQSTKRTATSRTYYLKAP